MKIVQFIQVSLLSILIVSFGCTKITEVERNSLTGSIQGKAQAVKAGTVRIYEDIRVSIDGTDFVTQTDENGKYLFENVPAGVYDLTYSYEGCADFKRCGVQLVGGGDYPISIDWVYVPEISNTVVTDLTVAIEFQRVRFRATINPGTDDNTSRGMFVCIYDDESVAYNKMLDWYFQNAISKPNEVDLRWLENTTLAGYIPEFDPDKTYYAVAYGLTDNNYSVYFDTHLGSEVVTGINPTPSNVVSFKVPAIVKK